jgi:cytidine deaminase
VLAEFAPGLVIEAVGPKASRRWTMDELLPASFGKEQLT